MQRKTLIYLAIVLVVVLAGTFTFMATLRNPIEVHWIGDIDVEIQLYHYLRPKVVFPESEYNLPYSMGLPDSFVDSNREGWHEDLHSFLKDWLDGKIQMFTYNLQVTINEGSSKEEDTEPWTPSLPPLEWLIANAKPKVDHQYIVKFVLPSEGSLQYIADRNDYEFWKDYYKKREKKYHPVHLILGDGDHLCTGSNILRWDNDPLFKESLRNVQAQANEYLNEYLVYMDPERKKFIVFNIPREIRDARPEEIAPTPKEQELRCIALGKVYEVNR